MFESDFADTSTCLSLGGEKNVFLLVRNIQKSKEIFSQFLNTLEGLLGELAQIKEDLTVLPENVVLESSKLVHFNGIFFSPFHFRYFSPRRSYRRVPKFCMGF